MANADQTNASTTEGSPSKTSHKPGVFVAEEQHLHGHVYRATVDELPVYAPPSALFLDPANVPAMHPDWSTLFFDLIYVGVTFNTGHIVGHGISTVSFFTFLIIFVSLFDSWMKHLWISASLQREDLYHRFIDILQGLVIAFAAYNVDEHIVDVYTGQMFYVVLAKLLHSFLIFTIWLELWVQGKTTQERGMGRLLCICLILGISCLIGALIASALPVFGAASEHRHLASSGDVDIHFIVSLSLLGCAYAVDRICQHVVIVCYGKEIGSEDANVIPMHYDFMLHRFGEWSMLMLGEGVLQIILVDLDFTVEYHFAFIGGYMLMALLQLCHYSVTPFFVEDHAISKSLLRGVAWIEMLAFYSACQVCVGVALKLLLEASKRAGGHSGHRLLRELAGATHSDSLTNEWLLCGALFVIMNLLIAQHLLHRGFAAFRGFNEDEKAEQEQRLGRSMSSKELRAQLGNQLKRKLFKKRVRVFCEFLFSIYLIVVPFFGVNETGVIWLALVGVFARFVTHVFSGSFDRDRMMRVSAMAIFAVAKLKRKLKLSRERKGLETSQSQTAKKVTKRVSRRRSIPKVASVRFKRFVENINLYRAPWCLLDWDKGVVVDREVDWADLFFDLIYVAILFKLGGFLLFDDKGPEVIWTYFSIFSVLYDCWEEKTLYSSRFSSRDVFHKVFDVLQGLSIAFATTYIIEDPDIAQVSHAQITDDNRKYIAGFIGSIIAYQAFRVFAWSEIALFSKGKDSRELGVVQLGLVLAKIVPLVVGIILIYTIDELPHWVATVCWAMLFPMSKIVQLSKSITGLDTKVPLHVEYMYHRYGEWMMLMLGEGVMQIIIVHPQVKLHHETTFIVSYLLLSMMQSFHYLVEADDTTKHALSHSQRGFFWSIVVVIESASVVCVGVLLKHLVVSPSIGPDSYTEFQALTLSVIAVLICLSLVDAAHNGQRCEWKCKWFYGFLLLKIILAACLYVTHYIKVYPEVFVLIVTIFVGINYAAQIAYENFREKFLASIAPQQEAVQEPENVTIELQNTEYEPGQNDVSKSQEQKAGQTVTMSLA